MQHRTAGEKVQILHRHPSQQRNTTGAGVLIRTEIEDAPVIRKIEGTRTKAKMGETPMRLKIEGIPCGIKIKKEGNPVEIGIEGAPAETVTIIMRMMITMDIRMPMRLMEIEEDPHLGVSPSHRPVLGSILDRVADLPLDPDSIH